MKTQLNLRLVLVLVVLTGLPPASAYYDPGVQRWINRDPVGERGGLNLYGFVSNAPVTKIDPLGEREREYCVYLCSRMMTIDPVFICAPVAMSPGCASCPILLARLGAQYLCRLFVQLTLPCPCVYA